MQVRCAKSLHWRDRWCMLERMEIARTRPRRPQDTLASRFRLMRYELGHMSQKEFALLVGLTPGAVQSIEDGRKPTGLDEKVLKIEQATGYDRAWVMWGEPRPTPTGGPTAPKVGAKITRIGANVLVASFGHAAAEVTPTDYPERVNMPVPA